MWVGGSIGLKRYREYQRVGNKWKKNSGWGASPTLGANPAKFLYAVARTAVRGHPPGWRGVRSAVFSACAALSYLERGVHSPTSLSLHSDLQLAKDFVGTGIKGVIGAAFSLIEAQALGYPWFGHWEDAFGPMEQGPDFLVFRSGEMVLVEAKGTAQDNPARASWLKAQWKGQIEPHLSWTGADHGWLIATCLQRSSVSFLERLTASSSTWSPGAPRVPPRVKALWLLRGIGRWLGWPSDREPYEEDLAARERYMYFVDAREMASLGDRIRKSPREDGLLLGPDITVQLSQTAALTAVTFCKADNAELLFSFAEGRSNAELPIPQSNARVQQLGHRVGIFWSDGTGMLVSIHGRSPQETIAALAGE